MLSTSELAAMRETSTSAMPDRVKITRIGAGGTLNPTTGVFTPSTSAVLYDGVGRVRAPASATEMERIFGDTEMTVQRYVVKVPSSTVGIQRDDRIAVTNSTDPDIVGRSFRVVSAVVGSNHVDRTLGVEEIGR
jgi:hypothetical protein